MSKKLLSIFVLVLLFSFTTQALASFTFSSSAITGAGATSVDTGTLFLSGSTSGKVTIAPAATAGTYTLTLPTTAGTASQYLQTNGSGVLTWATVADPSPAGADTQVQFNDGGAFAGDAGMTYNKTTDALTLVGSVNALNVFEDVTDSKLFIGSTAGNRTVYSDIYDPSADVSKRTVAIGTNAAVLGGVSAADNVAIGYYALSSNENGSTNVAIGTSALRNTITGTNVGIGYGALENQTSGGPNVAIGYQAANSTTTGSQNTTIGYSASLYDLTGYDNTVIGYLASDSRSPGSGNTIIGAWADMSVDGLSNATALGYEAVVTTSNTVVLGNDDVTSVLAGMYAEATLKAGALQLSTGSKPTCNATTRGTTWYVAGGTGVPDTYEVCRKDGADAYAWVSVY